MKLPPKRTLWILGLLLGVGAAYACRPYLEPPKKEPAPVGVKVVQVPQAPPKPAAVQVAVQPTAAPKTQGQAAGGWQTPKRPWLAQGKGDSGGYVLTPEGEVVKE